MTNIFENIDVHVRCANCTADFSVPAAVVLESQELLEGGCPGSEFECTATLFAQLIDREALHRLAVAWADIQESVRDSVCEVSLDARPSLRQLLTAAQAHPHH